MLQLPSLRPDTDDASWSLYDLGLAFRNVVPSAVHSRQSKTQLRISRNGATATRHQAAIVNATELDN
jgi:hypothetical protein